MTTSEKVILRKPVFRLRVKFTIIGEIRSSTWSEEINESLIEISGREIPFRSYIELEGRERNVLLSLVPICSINLRLLRSYWVNCNSKRTALSEGKRVPPVMDTLLVGFC